MTKDALNALTATQAATCIASGEITSESLVGACLDRIARREADVKAWAYLDPVGALRAAREADKVRMAKARPLGALHGVPIGLKDMIATADMPTTYNSEIYAGHQARADASVVKLLRATGAIILGKTETVEFGAWGGRVAVTSNPHDQTRTPGGSSSGSAAAVADFMVPLALGTQTGGSLVRPASYCGVAVIKPTFGTLSMEGIRRYAPTLDTLGWYARSVEDLQLLARIFGIGDESEPEAPPIKSLKIGVCRTPYWESSLPETRAAIEECTRRLANAGANVTDLELGPDFLMINEHRQTVMWAEGRVSFLELECTAPEKISPGIRKSMERISNKRLREALDYAARLRPVFDSLAENLDAIVTPSAPGEAPIGLASTGDSIFNGLWTILHVPCISLPGMTSPNGLPVGVQLVGPRYGDNRLLSSAKVISAMLLQ